MNNTDNNMKEIKETTIDEKPIIFDWEKSNFNWKDDLPSSVRTQLGYEMMSLKSRYPDSNREVEAHFGDTKISTHGASNINEFLARNHSEFPGMLEYLKNYKESIDKDEEIIPTNNNTITPVVEEQKDTKYITFNWENYPREITVMELVTSMINRKNSDPNEKSEIVANFGDIEINTVGFSNTNDFLENNKEKLGQIQKYLNEYYDSKLKKIETQPLINSNNIVVPESKINSEELKDNGKYVVFDWEKYPHQLTEKNIAAAMINRKYNDPNISHEIIADFGDIKISTIGYTNVAEFLKGNQDKLIQISDYLKSRSLNPNEIIDDPLISNEEKVNKLKLEKASLEQQLTKNIEERYLLTKCINGQISYDRNKKPHERKDTFSERIKNLDQNIAINKTNIDNFVGRVNEVFPQLNSYQDIKGIVEATKKAMQEKDFPADQYSPSIVDAYRTYNLAINDMTPESIKKFATKINEIDDVIEEKKLMDSEMIIDGIEDKNRKHQEAKLKLYNGYILIKELSENINTISKYEDDLKERDEIVDKSESRITRFTPKVEKTDQAISQNIKDINLINQKIRQLGENKNIEKIQLPSNSTYNNSSNELTIDDSTINYSDNLISWFFEDNKKNTKDDSKENSTESSSPLSLEGITPIKEEKSSKKKRKKIKKITKASTTLLDKVKKSLPVRTLSTILNWFKEHKKTILTAGISGTIVGLGAGALGLITATTQPKIEQKSGETNTTMESTNPTDKIEDAHIKQTETEEIVNRTIAELAEEARQNAITKTDDIHTSYDRALLDQVPTNAIVDSWEEGVASEYRIIDENGQRDILTEEEAQKIVDAGGDVAIRYDRNGITIGWMKVNKEYGANNGVMGK